MSVQDISELFQHIVQSEEKIKQRFEALKKVNKEIKEHQEKIKCIHYDTGILRSKINTVNHKLMQEKIEKNWLVAVNGILKDQRDDCLKEKDSLTTQIKEKKSYQDEHRRNFLSDCDSSTQKYFGMCFGDNAVEYNDNWKEEFDRLSKEHQTVLNEIEYVEEEQVRRNMLEQERDHQKKLFSDHVTRKEALTETLSITRREIAELEVTKQNQIKKVSIDPEFQRIFREMESRKDECAILSKKHQELTQQLYELQKSVLAQSKPKPKKHVNAWTFTAAPDPTGINKGKRRFPYNKIQSGGGHDGDELGRMDDSGSGPAS